MVHYIDYIRCRFLFTLFNLLWVIVFFNKAIVDRRRLYKLPLFRLASMLLFSEVGPPAANFTEFSLVVLAFEN